MQSENLKNQGLICEICGKNFVFSKGEQEFFAEKGLENVPKSCPECRAKKRAGEKIAIEEKCSICGKTGAFRKKIDAEKLICSDCISKIKPS